MTVKWNVLDSDNQTTLRDTGEVRFMRQGDKTRIEFQSEHRIDAFPGTLAFIERSAMLDKPTKVLTANILRGFFKTCIEGYREVARTGSAN